MNDGHVRKLKFTFKNNKEVTLQIDKSKTLNYVIYLTKIQINQIGNGKRIKISKTQRKMENLAVFNIFIWLGSCNWRWCLDI